MMIAGFNNVTHRAAAVLEFDRAPDPTALRQQARVELDLADVSEDARQEASDEHLGQASRLEMAALLADEIGRRHT